MTKAELVDKMARASGVTKKSAERALGALLGGIKESLKKGKRVTLVGFGSFSVAKRAARNGRNPQTGKPIKIPATKVPKFKAGKELKDAVK
ncbi:MAG: HU family DNA-binding protein [candidate division NC10 bacterium]|nr:HU family DNA-binding protein [candidate division NC10 bacterium]